MLSEMLTSSGVTTPFARVPKGWGLDFSKGCGDTLLVSDGLVLEDAGLSYFNAESGLVTAEAGARYDGR